MLRLSSRISAALAFLAVTSCAPRLDSEAGAEGRQGYLEAGDGVRLFYRTVGAGPETVVVVHGGPGAGMDAVRPDFGPLANGRTVVYYDQRGGGRSTLPADTGLLGARNHVEDLEAVRRHFDLEKMDVVAHSFGSILVAEYAKSYPQRLGRIVFVGTTGPRRASAGELARNQFAGADPDLLEAVRQPMAELMSGTADDPIAACEAYRVAGAELARSLGQPLVKAKGSECLMPADALSYYFQYTAQLSPASFGAWDYTTELGFLETPLLVIYGARDVEGLVVQREWLDAVRSARILAVSGAGKAVHVERPERVFEAIDRFLEPRPRTARGGRPGGSGASRG